MLSEPHKLFKLIWQKKKCFFYSAFCPQCIFGYCHKYNRAIVTNFVIQGHTSVLNAAEMRHKSKRYILLLKTTFTSLFWALKWIKAAQSIQHCIALN